MNISEINISRAALAFCPSETVQFRLIRDAMYDSVTILAKTKQLENVGRSFIVPTLEKEPAPWIKSKWARLVRWCCSKKWWHKLVPHPLEALAFAEFVTIGHRVEDFSEDVWSSIMAQIAEIEMNGDKPVKILIGHKACEDLAKTMNFNQYISFGYAVEDKSFGKICNIPAIFTKKICPNSVLVI